MKMLRMGPMAVMLILVGGMAMPVVADDAYDTCLDQSDGTNPAWAQCGADWVDREDKVLNDTWKEVFSGLEGQTKDDLLAEQRLWNSYKENSCEFYANGDWGRERQVLDFFMCRAGVIAARTQQLKDYGTFFAGP